MAIISDTVPFSPESAFLESKHALMVLFGNNIQLQEQIVLLQSLCEKITQEVELPEQAIAGLGGCSFK